MLKRRLKTRNGDLHILLSAIEHTLAELQENYRQNLQDQTSKKVLKYNLPVMIGLRYLVSFPALGLIANQVEIATEVLQGKRQLRASHTGAYRRQYGLPCWHEILSLLRADSELNLTHVDKHWWLTDKQVSRLYMFFSILC